MATAQEHFDNHTAIHHLIVTNKEQLKALRVAGEAAGTAARYATEGTMQEKLEAIREAWKPFRTAIEETEQEIKALYTRFDEEWSAYKLASLGMKEEE